MQRVNSGRLSLLLAWLAILLWLCTWIQSFTKFDGVGSMLRALIDGSDRPLQLMPTGSTYEWILGGVYWASILGIVFFVILISVMVMKYSAIPIMRDIMRDVKQWFKRKKRGSK